MLRILRPLHPAFIPKATMTTPPVANANTSVRKGRGSCGGGCASIKSAVWPPLTLDAVHGREIAWAPFMLAAWCVPTPEGVGKVGTSLLL